jgi:competence protein ComEC
MSNLTLKKIFKILSLFLALNLFLLGLVLIEAKSPKNLEVTFFDLEGEAIFIKTPYNQKILIDGGLDKTIVNKLGETLPFWDRTIDLMILTHPHSDHVTGLIEVLRRYQVRKVFYTGIFYFEPNYLLWRKLLKEKNISTQIVRAGDSLILGKDLKLITLWPSEAYLEKKPENINNTSIVNKLIYKNISFLFTGDLEWEGEEELLKGPFSKDLQADILKIGHHGSISSSTEDFLKAVRPKWAIIVVKENDEIDHPSLRVLKRLERMKIKILRTDQRGDVKFFTENGSLEIESYPQS